MHPAWALESDIFGTTENVARRAVHDDGRGDLSCSFGRLPERLTLEEAIERILCNDPQTRISWANAKAQAAQVGVSESAYLPRLDGHLGSSDGDSQVDYDEASLHSGEGSRRSNSASIELSWVLVDFGRRGAALRNARQLLLAANATQDATLQNTFAQAAQAYYDALSAQRSLAASVQIAELAARNLEAADAKYHAGAAALSDRLQAQTAFSQANLRQIRDRGELHSALGIIALRMGLSPETPLQLAGDLTPLPDTQFVKAVDELLMQALQDHPAVLAAKARLNAAQAAVDERRSASLPSLALTADLSYERNKQPRVFSGNSAERDRSIGLQLSIPLFDGFGRRYEVRNAQARAEAGQAELAETQQQVALDLWANYQALKIENLKLQRTGELVDQSRQSLDVVQGRYHAGVGSMIELLNALTAYAGAEDEHIQTLSNWQTSRLRLMGSLGHLGGWALH